MGFFGPPNIEKMEAKGDVEGLIKALKDKDKVVRKEATIALGRVKDTRAVEPLIEAMKDKDYHVQRQAAQALGKIGDARALEPLIKTLEDYFVREKAAEALVEILDAGAVEALIQCVDAGVAKALRDMKEMKDKREVDLLIKTLGDEDEDIRQKTVEALGNIGDARAVEPLIKALGDEDKKVQMQAAKALGKIGDARAMEPLIEALKDEDKKVQMQAAKALDKLHWKPIDDSKKVLFLLAKRDWDAVVKLGLPAVEPLIEALKDEDKKVRTQAAEALGKIGDARAMEPLIEALKDEDKKVQMQAAVALGNIGDARALEPLIKALGDEEEDVRNQAASFVAKSKYSKARLFAEYIEINWYGIGETDIDRGIGLLHQLSKDSNPWITDYVIYELRKFMGDRSRYLYLNHTLDVAKELINRAEDRFLGFLVRYFRESKRKLEGTPEFAEFKILYENKDVYEKWRTQISTDELISMYAHADSSGDILVDLLKNPSLKSIKFIEREISKWESWPSSLFELVEEMLKSQDERFSNALTKFIQMAEKWASHVTPGFEDWEDWELKRAKHEEVDDIDQLNKRIITYFQQASKG